MITGVTAEPIGAMSWVLSWTSDAALDDEGRGPECFVYRDGALVWRGRSTSMTVFLAAGEEPVFEVFDDEEDEPALGLPAGVALNWSATAGAARYRVEQLVGATWESRRTLNGGRDTRFTWRSERLADGETHSFRVIPIGADGNEGAATSFVVLVVRTPDVPGATLAYDAGASEVTFDLA